MIPTYNKDIYTKEAILNANSVYRELREMGEVVYLSKHKLYAITSFDGVRKALRANTVFLSGNGVSANNLINSIPKKLTLMSDGEAHRNRKQILMKPLNADRMKFLKTTIKESAEQLVQDLLKKKEIEVINDFAAYLPLSIVSDLVGLPKEGKDKMLEWGAAGFNTFGPLNWRTIKSLPKVIFGMRRFALNLSPKEVHPNGWAAGIFKAVEEGKIAVDEGQNMIIDYVGPSLDTTILAAGHLFWQLAKHPEAFKEIRANPNLIPGVINEVVRLSSPVRGFTRYVAEDFDLNGNLLPKDSRALVLFASANWDAKQFPNPEKFDIHRNPKEQMGWGHGVHVCAGMHLARLELEELLTALCKYAKRLEVGKETFIVNNGLQGFKSLAGTLS